MIGDPPPGVACRNVGEVCLAPTKRRVGKPALRFSSAKSVVNPKKFLSSFFRQLSIDVGCSHINESAVETVRTNFRVKGAYPCDCGWIVFIRISVEKVFHSGRD